MSHRLDALAPGELSALAESLREWEWWHHAKRYGDWPVSDSELARIEAEIVRLCKRVGITAHYAGGGTLDDLEVPF